MNISLAEQYFLKAQESYDYDCENLVESLNYALSYDDEHAPSLCLLGRLKMEKTKAFNDAAHCFEHALVSDSYYVETYKYYSLLLIWIGEFAKAEKLLTRSEKIKGMPKVVIIQRRATILECQGKVNKAVDQIRKGKLISACTVFYDFFTTEEGRLKKKMKKNSKKNKLRKKTAQ